MWKKTRTSNSNAQLKQVFFERLGYWLTVDPLVPPEKLVENTDVSSVTNSTTTYSLKSFTLSR